MLIKRPGRSLRPIISEAQTGISVVTTVESVDLPVPGRSIDSVLRLRRESRMWNRHLAFQSGPDPNMPRR